ncbi:MAG: holo-ACP synthase [Pseudomonadota bacterium]
MILGIGNDMVSIPRIDASINRFGERFLNRIFTDIEREKSDRRAARSQSYAKRFAAKEACSKALGTGFRRGVYWRDMGVVNLPTGQPTMALTGGAAERLKSMMPRGHQPQILLTITDDDPWAQAFVMIAALSPQEAVLLARTPAQMSQLAPK